MPTNEEVDDVIARNTSHGGGGEAGGLHESESIYYGSDGVPAGRSNGPTQSIIEQHKEAIRRSKEDNTTEQLAKSPSNFADARSEGRKSATDKEKSIKGQAIDEEPAPAPGQKPETKLLQTGPVEGIVSSRNMDMFRSASKELSMGRVHPLRYDASKRPRALVEDVRFSDQTYEVEESRGFPGLLTVYHLYTVDIYQTGLPLTNFVSLQFKGVTGDEPPARVGTQTGVADAKAVEREKSKDPADNLAVAAPGINIMQASVGLQSIRKSQDELKEAVDGKGLNPNRMPATLKVMSEKDTALTPREMLEQFRIKHIYHWRWVQWTQVLDLMNRRVHHLEQQEKLSKNKLAQTLGLNQGSYNKLQQVLSFHSLGANSVRNPVMQINGKQAVERNLPLKGNANVRPAQNIWLGRREYRFCIERTMQRSATGNKCAVEASAD